MDFFERQDRARRNTKWLVLYFVAAVVCIILGIYLVFAGIFLRDDFTRAGPAGLWHPQLFLGVTAGTCLVVLFGSLYKLSELLRESEGTEDKVIIARALDLLFGSVAADRGVIMTRFAPEAVDLEVAAVKYRDQPITPTKVSISRTILDQVLNQKVAILSQDTNSDSRFNISESIIMNQIRSAICVPLRRASGCWVASLRAVSSATA